MPENTFKIVILGIFGVLCLLGFASLAIYGSRSQNSQTSPTDTIAQDLVIWGTLPSREVRALTVYFDELEGISDTYESFTYVEQPEETFREDLFKVIALGETPDLILSDHTTIFSLEDILTILPFSYIPKPKYQSRYTEIANIFEYPDGFIAMPFLSDPLVLYYNENTRLKNNSLILPTMWSELASDSYIEVTKQNNGVIKESLIPLGGYANFENAVDVFLALILQIRRRTDVTKEEIKHVLRYYIDFANPISPSYSWNVTLPDARRMFVGDRLLFYPGYVSEYEDLRRSNPNIAIRTALLPQLERDTAPSTIGRLYGLAVPTAAPSIAFSAKAMEEIYSLFFDKDELGRVDYKKNLGELFTLIPPLREYSAPADATRTQQQFISAMNTSETIVYSEEDGDAIREILRGVAVGAESVDGAANRLYLLLRNKI